MTSQKNNCETHVAQYLTKTKQPDNETWSVNRLKQENNFPSKNIEKMRQGNYNLGQNIWRLFDVLAQFLFTTSETELDYYHQKVSSRVAERLRI